MAKCINCGSPLSFKPEKGKSGMCDRCRRQAPIDPDLTLREFDEMMLDMGFEFDDEDEDGSNESSS